MWRGGKNCAEITQKQDGGGEEEEEEDEGAMPSPSVRSKPRWEGREGVTAEVGTW